MPTVLCLKCDASAVAVRTDGGYSLRLGAGFRWCQELEKRLSAGEKALSLGECSTFAAAVKRVLAENTQQTLRR